MELHQDSSLVGGAPEIVYTARLDISLPPSIHEQSRSTVQVDLRIAKPARLDQAGPPVEMQLQVSH